MASTKKNMNGSSVVFDWCECDVDMAIASAWKFRKTSATAMWQCVRQNAQHQFDRCDWCAMWCVVPILHMRATKATKIFRVWQCCSTYILDAQNSWKIDFPQCDANKTCVGRCCLYTISVSHLVKCAIFYSIRKKKKMWDIPNVCECFSIDLCYTYSSNSIYLCVHSFLFRLFITIVAFIVHQSLHNFQSNSVFHFGRFLIFFPSFRRYSLSCAFCNT